jgi:hypothetical protein
VAKAEIAAVLALVAALFSAISDAVQQRLAYDVTNKRSVRSRCSASCCEARGGGWAAWLPRSASRCRPRR